MEGQGVGPKLTKVLGEVNYTSSVTERSCDVKKKDEVYSKDEGRHQIAAADSITEESDREEQEEEEAKEEEMEVVGEEAEGDEDKVVVEEEVEVEEVKEIVKEEEKVAEDEGEEEIEIIEEILVVEEEEEEEEVEIEEIIEEEEQDQVAVEEEFDGEGVRDEEEEPDEVEGGIKNIPKELRGSALGKKPKKISNEAYRKEELGEESCERAGVTTEVEETLGEEDEEQEEVEAPSEVESNGQLYLEEQNEEAPVNILTQHPSFCSDRDANKVKSTHYFSSSRHLVDAKWSRSQRQENLEPNMGKKSSYGTVLSDAEKKLAANLEDHQNIRWEERFVADGSATHGGEADGTKTDTIFSNAVPHLRMQGYLTNSGADTDINLVLDEINKKLTENKSCPQPEVEVREIEEDGNEIEEEEEEEEEGWEGEEEEDEDEEDPDEIEESFPELSKEQLYEEEPNKESLADFPVSTMFADTGWSLPTEIEGDEEIEVEEEEDEGEDEEEEEPDEVKEYSQDLAKKQLYEGESNKKSVADFAISTQLADAGLFLAHRKQNMDTSYGTLLFGVKDHAGISCKRRKSRWGERPEASGGAVNDGEADGKKRKTRWSNNEPQVQIQGFNTCDYASPDIQALDLELFEINKKLEALAKQKTKQLLKHTLKTTAKLQAEEEPSKFQKKLYIPTKEYPNYNFVGLLLGPKGHTLKEMKKKTGARIYLQGKGSKIGSCVSEGDDLHVLINADDQKSFNEAVGMVENILIPVNDHDNSLKKQQLKELAKIKDKLRKELKRHKSTRDNLCELCGTSGHLSLSCPLTAPNAEDTMGHHAKFLSELGNGVLSFSNANSMQEPLPSLSFNDANSTRELHLPSKTLSDANSVREPPLSSKTVDTSKLYVCFLPRSMDKIKLRDMFSAFGKINSVFIAREKETGLCRGYGFVKYADPSAAAKAIEKMHEHQIENKKLAVRIAGIEPSSTANSNLGSTTTHAFSQSAMYPSNVTSIQTIPYTRQEQGHDPSPIGANLSAMHPNDTIVGQTLLCMGQNQYPASSSYQLPNYGGQNMPYPFYGESHYGPWVGQPSAGLISSVQPPAHSIYSGDIKSSKILSEFPGFRSSLNSEFGQSVPKSSLFDFTARPPGMELGNISHTTEVSKSLTHFPGFRSSLNSEFGQLVPRPSLFDFITRPPGMELGNISHTTEVSKAVTHFPGFRSSLDSELELPRRNLFDFQ